MYIYKTDLSLYEHVYCSNNQSTMFLKADNQAFIEYSGEMEFLFSSFTRM